MAIPTYANGALFESRFIHANCGRCLARPPAGDRICVCLDDVVIPTAGSLEDHLRDVGMVFDKLLAAGFELSLPLSL